jgi:hypothetical protein
LTDNRDGDVKATHVLIAPYGEWNGTATEFFLQTSGIVMLKLKLARNWSPVSV